MVTPAQYMKMLQERDVARRRELMDEMQNEGTDERDEPCE